jgi:hypothetical protein
MHIAAVVFLFLQLLIGSLLVPISAAGYTSLSTKTRYEGSIVVQCVVDQISPEELRHYVYSRDMQP